MQIEGLSFQAYLSLDWLEPSNYLLAIWQHTHSQEIQQFGEVEEAADSAVHSGYALELKLGQL